MTLETKDIIYIIVYVVSVAGVFFAFKNKLNNVEKENGQVRRILFGDRGTLNLVDVKTCEKYRDEVFAAIRRGEQVNQMLLQKLEELAKNVIVIMVSLNIKSPNGIFLNEPKKDPDNL